MDDRFKMHDLPWHAMQRRFAESLGTNAPVYRVGRGMAHPHWRFAGTASWVSGTRNGVSHLRQSSPGCIVR